MDWSYWLPIITALFGVFLGWFLNELGFYFRCQREDKRQLKEVLYNLLEVWHLMKNSDLDSLTNMTVEELRRRIPEIRYNEKVQAILAPILSKIVSSLVPQISKEDIKNIQARYQNAVNALSKVDPLLAFRISGKPEIYNYIQSLNTRLENVKTTLSDLKITGDLNELNKINPALKPVIMGVVIDNFEQDLRKISLRISLPTWFNINRKLKKVQYSISNEISKKLDEALINFKEYIQQKNLGNSVKEETE